MNTKQRTIHEIARDMIRVWWQQRSKKKAYIPFTEWRRVVSCSAVPYLNALLSMEGQEGYGLDSTDDIILYGLNNMSSFRGPEAKALKAELRAHLSSQSLSV